MLEKANIYISKIKAALDANCINWKNDESLIGKLSHIEYVISHSRHFLSIIRTILKQGKKDDNVRLLCKECLNFKLWIEFLVQARTGILINSVVFCCPSLICWSDMCTLGINRQANNGLA